MTDHSVTAEHDGVRLDRFVAAQAGVGTRAAAERLVAAGAVTVDGRVRSKSYRLTAGELVGIAETAAPEPRSGPLPDVPIVYRG